MSSTNALRVEIASELNRALTDPFGNSGETFNQAVTRAINQAQWHYESTRFRFNEVRRFQFATTANGQTDYSLPANFISMDSLEIIRTGQYVPVTRASLEEINKLNYLPSMTAAAGLPSLYAISGNILVLGVAPNGAYTLAGTYIKRIHHVSATDSTTAVLPVAGGSYSLTVTTTTSHKNRINGWTTDARELIKARAIAYLKIFYQNDSDAKQEMAIFAAKGENYLSVREAQAFKAMADETFDALATGRIKPYCI